ncbi:hypothetical protein HID58_000876 [Brassica napus]|uniref:Uncharacterized protein n=1 Tax=Brassica napus TaxID=3708 RepID=A0ABQ8EHT4_BRANA|nr:hypothetical protein HID58_000876 [Brassica napus]
MEAFTPRKQSRRWLSCGSPYLPETRTGGDGSVRLSTITVGTSRDDDDDWGLSQSSDKAVGEGRPVEAEEEHLGE